ncbi:hypothetical protein OG204_19725 [Streptomyces sp. NBC_01387]|uniref:hypothetical protein n=1 Tax=Streptomyces sp. NBC_01387 TaxID=2903849 RepID=UPI00324A911C
MTAVADSSLFRGRPSDRSDGYEDTGRTVVIVRHVAVTPQCIGGQVNPSAVEAMKEAGIDIADRKPTIPPPLRLLRDCHPLCLPPGRRWTLFRREEGLDGRTLRKDCPQASVDELRLIIEAVPEFPPEVITRE